MSEAEEIVISVICPVELFSTLNRLRREKKISTQQYKKLESEIVSDLKHIQVVEVTPGVIRFAIFGLQETTLAAMDAIHIASSKDAQCDLFLTADLRQHKAAVDLKIPSEFVLKHP